MKKKISKNIVIYFSHFETPMELSVEEILPILSSYMPFDIIEKHYEYKDSYIIGPNEDNDGKENIYYIISYALTEDAKLGYSKGEHSYSGSLDVQIVTDADDNVQTLGIGFGLPRWMGSLDLNSYHKSEWECDLKDYR